MEDITGWKPSPRRRRTNPFFPDSESLQPTASLQPIIRRGPMYSAYAELREWNLRRKKAGLNLSMSTPTKTSPTSLYSHSLNDLSPAYRKENKKPMAPLPPATPKLDFSVTPSRPVAPKAELRRTVSTAVAGREEEKRGGGVIAMTKNYSCLKELEEFAVMAGSDMDGERKEGKGVHKGIFKKTVASFQRQTTTWMA